MLSRISALYYLHQTIAQVVKFPTSTAPVTGLSSFRDITPTTSDDNVGATVSAGAANTGATGTNAGSVAGGVIGGLLGLAVVGFIVAFVLVSLFPLFLSIFMLSKSAVTASYKAKTPARYAPRIRLWHLQPLCLCYRETPLKAP